MWYDATDPYAGQKTPGPAVGSTLSYWFDKSGYSTATAANKTGTPMITITGSPTYQNDNGYPSVFFDGSSYMRSSNTTNIPGSTSFTMFVVGRTTSSSAAQARMFSHSRVDVTVTPIRFFYIDAQSTNGSMGAYYDTATSPPAVYKYSANYAGSTRAGIHTIVQPGLANPTLFLNGRSVALANSAGSVSSTNLSSTDIGYTTIGGGYTTSGNITQRLTGHVYEVLAYTSALDSKNRQMIEGYLAWKWDLVDLLPANHTFKKVAPYLAT